MQRSSRFRRALPLFAAAALAAPLALVSSGLASATPPGPAPTIDASFSPSSIEVNANSTLTFTITDNDSVDLVNGAFTLALPSGLEVAAPNAESGACDAGTISAVAGSSSISLSAADIDTEGPCVFSVDVTGTIVGTQTITTSTITSDGDAAAVGATASLDVTAPAGVRGCRDYSGASFIGAVVLNPDGTPIGCGIDDPSEGAPADLTPTGWPTTNSDFSSAIASRDEGGSTTATFTPRLGYSCDDCSIGAGGADSPGAGLPIGFPINFFGTTFNDVFMNSNGSISFGAGSDSYNQPLGEVLNGSPGVVPYAIDLYNGDVAETDNGWGSGQQPDFFYWGRTTYQGHSAFAATWINMRGCCDDSTGAVARSTFQVLLVNVDDNSDGNVDVVINYGSLGDIDQGYGCDAGSCLAAGLGTVDNSVSPPVTSYASLVDDSGTVYDGQTVADVADDGTNPLDVAHLNSATPGRFDFQMRDGALPQTLSVPGAVISPSATMPDTTATLTWSAPLSTGGSPITDYQLRYRIAGSSDAWTTDAPTGTTDVFNELIAGTTYEYQIAAENVIGIGPWSTLAEFPAAAGGGTSSVTPDDVVTPTTRVAGTDRFDTAVAVSSLGYPTSGSAGAVVLARADNYPDALVGAPLAAQNNGPLLFTTGSSLPAGTLAEIQRVLDPGKTVYLLGNETAIPASIATEITALGYQVVRFGGADRFATAVAVADALGDPSTVLLATGENFADALAAGPAAAKVTGAVLLTDGSVMPPATAAYLKAHPGTVYAIGAPAVAADPAATPIAGADRYATATATASMFFTDPTKVGIASGTSYADALSAGAYLAHTGGPLVLSDGAELSSATGVYLNGTKASVTSSNTFGGTDALSANVQDQIAAALGSS